MNTMNTENKIALATVPEIPVGQPSLTHQGEEIIENALALGARIGRVSNESENKAAVDAQIEIRRILKELEDMRVKMTKPALEYQRALKAFFDSKSKDLQETVFRIGKLTGSYLQLQESKRRAEENARREELTKLEREREAALAQANTHEEREILQDHYNQRAAVEATPPPAPIVKPKGQALREDWEITVNDVHLLARSRPSCVKITPLMSEIKSLLNAGFQVEGVIATKVKNASVRLPRGSSIDV